MVWTVTLVVNDCNTMDPLKDVSIFVSGIGSLGSTDANGQFIFFADDVYQAVLAKLQHPAATATAAFGYIEKSHSFNRANNGKTETVCLNPSPPTDPTGEDPVDPCFIVTAATGSAMSQEAVALRATRERVALRSRLAGELIDRIYAEYVEFSPPLAARLRGDPAARALVLEAVVRPLFTWYQLAATLAFEPRDGAAIGREVAAHRAASAALASGAAQAGWHGRSGPLALTGMALGLPFVRWAIVDPLTTIASEPEDPVRAVADWLALAPLEALGPPAGEGDLRSLAGFLDFDPEARRRLGARLLGAWPDWQDALAGTGFTSVPQTV